MTRLSIRLTPADLIEGGRIHYLTSLLRVVRARNLGSRLTRWSFFLLFAFAAAPALFGAGPSRFVPLGYFAVLLACVAALSALAYFVTIPLRAKRNFAQQAPLKGDIALEWDKSTTHWRADAWSLDLPFRDYVAFTERDGVVLLYQTPLLYQLIPERAFPSEADRRALIAAAAAAGVEDASVADWSARSRGA